MATSKRRLSNGISSITLDLEDDENMNIEYAPVPKMKVGGSRRRSSFGGGMLGGHKSPSKNAAEQARIADMYETYNCSPPIQMISIFSFSSTHYLLCRYKVIIKMSSENKITAKNSWDLNLIDHMGQIIKEDTGHRGVNFQKASCTLDASVKIYSNRG